MASYQMGQVHREEILQLSGNSRCIDCGRANPEWASVSLGTLICLDCSGQHRALGTHLSFVRSLNMDSWNLTQLQNLKRGGNRECAKFLAKHGVRPGLGSIRGTYDCPAAELYRQVLKARVEGRPEPTELKTETRDDSVGGSSTTHNTSGIRMEGFGSGPPLGDMKSKRKGLRFGGTLIKQSSSPFSWFRSGKREKHRLRRQSQ